ncbi:glycosyltransferase [Patescibacteria group bacterium]
MSLASANFQPLVTIVIPTLSRADYAINTLRDCLSQDYGLTEIVVVEQSKKSQELVEYCERHKDKIAYLFLEKPNTARAKNIGAKSGTGEIVVFLDDDISLPGDFISKYVAEHADSSVGAVCSKILQPSDPLPAQNDGVVGRVKPYGSIIANYGSNKRTQVDTVHGCAAYKRSVLDQVGGFEESFIGNAMREESDLSMRVKKEGYLLVFDPSNEFTHIKAPTGGTRSKQDRLDWYYDFFHNDFLFFLRNRRRYWMPIFFISKLRPILACGWYYGKGRPRAVLLPLRAYYAGYKTYKRIKK